MSEATDQFCCGEELSWLVEEVAPDCCDTHTYLLSPCASSSLCSPMSAATATSLECEEVLGQDDEDDCELLELPDAPLPLPPPFQGRSRSLGPPCFVAMPCRPANLRRARSTGSSSVSALYRESTGRFYGQQIQRQDKRWLAELRELICNMHKQDQKRYALPADYLDWLDDQLWLQDWRTAVVRWLVKFVRRYQATNREVIWTALNLFDRILATDPARAEQGREEIQRVVLTSVDLALKLYHNDPHQQIVPLCHLKSMLSVALDKNALFHREFRTVADLKGLNTLTPGSMIHHLLAFMPTKETEFLVSIDERANDLALLALEDVGFLRYPVLVISVTAIWMAMEELGHDSDWMQWMEALDDYGVEVCHLSVRECREHLQCAADAAAAEESVGGCFVQVGSGMCSLGGGAWDFGELYLPNYLRAFDRMPFAPAVLPPHGLAEPSPEAYKPMCERAESPTGVEEIYMVEQHTMRSVPTRPMPPAAGMGGPAPPLVQPMVLGGAGMGMGCSAFSHCGAMKQQPTVDVGRKTGGFRVPTVAGMAWACAWDEAMPMGGH